METLKDYGTCAGLPYHSSLPTVLPVVRFVILNSLRKYSLTYKKGHV